MQGGWKIPQDEILWVGVGANCEKTTTNTNAPISITASNYFSLSNHRYMPYISHSLHFF